MRLVIGALSFDWFDWVSQKNALKAAKVQPIDDEHLPSTTLGDVVSAGAVTPRYRD